MELYLKRVDTVQKLMQQHSVDYLLLGPTANMYYFSGLQTSPDERLQLVIIPSTGQTGAVLPAMYREKALAVFGDSVQLVSWSDSEDPFQIACQKFIGTNAYQIAVDNTLRADHLIGLIKLFPLCHFEPASQLTGKIRIYKDQHEIKLMAGAGEAADRVMEKVQAEISPGITESELALFIEVEYKKVADDISFKPIVASGPNAALPHHSPGERKLENGDFVVIDCGALIEGYCSDITRTFCLGRASADMKKVYQTVQEANDMAYHSLEKSQELSAQGLDSIARSHIDQSGYGQYFIHRLGHGIGLEVHEDPYLVEGNSEILSTGMAFTIEPGIYIPDQFGVRIEDTVVITDHGLQRLTGFSRDLIEI